MSETCIRFGEFGARVMIEDEEVPHYAMHIDPVRREVSCWIASEVGKAFSVVWLELDIEYPSGGMLYLDGHCARLAMRQSAAPIIYQHLVSESSYVPFLFSPLVVTDDDTYLDTSSTHSIGEIKLVIVRTTIPEVIAEEEHTIYREPPHLQKVHESSKKAIAHRVKYGSEIPRPRMTTYSAKPIERILTFIFKYRPLEMLRADGVVPHNPEPLEYPLTSETSSEKGKHPRVKKEADSQSGSETDDEDSMREKALLAEVQRCQAEVERIRKGRHSKDTNERPKKRFKKEDGPHFIPGEVIDLT